MALSRMDNERLTRVGAGTPMGETMRRYWLPALLSAELPEPDGPPVRVRLLGENLVAFRDTGGRLGLLEEFCPHRRTSLFLGRNEEGGLRCVYHGWKFDADGNCLDMMNEPEGSDYHTKVRAVSYPAVEMGGVVWAYLGPAERRPPLPRFEWTQVPDSHRLITKNRQECNWLQGLEGGIDTAHAPILHRRITKNTTRPGFGVDTDFVTGKAPKVEVDRTDYGYRYAGIPRIGRAGPEFRPRLPLRAALSPDAPVAVRVDRRGAPDADCRALLGADGRRKFDGVQLDLQFRRGTVVGGGPRSGAAIGPRAGGFGRQLPRHPQPRQ